MVEQTLAWYLRGGTGSVLTEYLGALYQGGRLEEWYHYGGNPYFFKAMIDLELDDEIETGTGDKIAERIRAYKMCVPGWKNWRFISVYRFLYLSNMRARSGSFLTSILVLIWLF